MKLRRQGASLSSSFPGFIPRTPSSSRLGFTLIELLVVIAIIAVLTGIIGGNFLTSRMRARDTERKANLRDLQAALEMYYNDHGNYPSSQVTSNGNGRIGTFLWGRQSFTDALNGNPSTVYMQMLPGDPQMPDNQYHYEVDDTQRKYRIYARLENEEDIDALMVDDGSGTMIGAYTGKICSETNSDSVTYCNYGVSSSTTSMTESW